MTYREEICTGDESDDKGQTENARVLSQSLREHGVLGEFGLPEEEGDEQYDSKDERDEDVNAAPGVLVAAPLHAHHEEQLRCCQRTDRSLVEGTPKLTMPGMLSAPPTQSIWPRTCFRVRPWLLMRGGGK